MASILKIGNSWRVQIRRKGMSKAVKSFQSLEDAKDYAKKSEDQSRLDGMPIEISSLPRVKSDHFIGVYFLFRGDACVYVGQSSNVHARVKKHRAILDFDDYAWIPVPTAELDEVERQYIRAISPSYNKTWKIKPAKKHSRKSEPSQLIALKAKFMRYKFATNKPQAQ